MFLETAGLILGLTVSPRWFILTGVVLAFLLQHSLQGYCPPMVWFRAFGWRTAGEIEDEKVALRLLHGVALPSAMSGYKGDKKRMLDEMIETKNATGRFLGKVDFKAAAENAHEE
jgi:hypothetical protein